MSTIHPYAESDQEPIFNEVSEKNAINPNKIISVEPDKKPEGFYISKRAAKIGAFILAGIVAASAGIATIFGNQESGATPTFTTSEANESTSESSNNSAVITETEVTVSVPSESQTETTGNSVENIDYTKPVKNIVEGYSFEYVLNMDQQAIIKGYDAMDVLSFQKLSQDEQAILGDWVATNYRPRFDVILKNNNIDLHYTDNPQTAEEILENYCYMTSMCCSLVEIDEDGNGGHADVELGQKVIGAYVNTLTENHIESGNQLVSQTNGGIGLFDIDMEVTASKTYSDGSIIINSIWHETDSVTVLPGAEFSQKTFIPFTFTDIYGENKTIYLRSSAVGENDVNYIDIG